MAKDFTLSTGKLLFGGLPRISVVMITDRPDITSAVNRGRYAINQQTRKKQVRLPMVHFCAVLL